MAVKFLSKSTIAQGLPRSSKFWDQVSTIGDYQSISTISVGSGGSSSIQFTSIPNTYKHLQIRGFSHANTASGIVDHLLYANSDGAANYSYHWIYNFDGGAVGAVNGVNANQYSFGYAAGNNSGTSVFSNFVIDFFDYANTNKFKTFRGICANEKDSGGNSSIVFSSGNWRSTSAINSITINLNGANYSQYSYFALYGIKG